jgi:crotonobetainyl-CoA:carnitine CoA-transferase CaiB-like acyl-CoA transferase
MHEEPVLPSADLGAVRGPLAGVTVLELGMVMQVPLAAQMLGDYGADVIKVERQPPGEILRTLDPIATEEGTGSCYYAALGRNKRTLSLDIKSPEGHSTLMRLVEKADVLLHNFRPGVMERLGLGYEQLAEHNPRLVYAAGFAFGETGPLASMPGQDMLAQAYSGFALSGVADGDPPKISNTPVIDYMTALSLTQGIMAALIERQRSGLGQKVTTSLLDVAFAAQVLEVSSIAVHGERTSWIKRSMSLAASDGWLIVLTLFRDNPLKAICSAFDLPDMSAEEGLATADQQNRRLTEIEERLRPVFARYTVAECIEKLGRHDVLCSPFNTLETAMASEQIRHNGMLWNIPVAGKAERELVGNPVKLSRTPLGLREAPSCIGGMSANVLSRFGFGQDEIDRLIERGVVYADGKAQ